MKGKATLIIFCLTLILSTLSPKFEEEPAPIIAPEPTIEAIDIRDYWAEHPEESPVEEIRNAHAMAIVAEAVCPDGASENCLIAVMACVWNRANTVGFPNTIEEVAAQPYQWEGLTSDSTYSNETAKLARQKIQEWQSSNELPIPSNCVFLRLDSGGIWFRSEWKGNDEVFVRYDAST